MEKKIYMSPLVEVEKVKLGVSLLFVSPDPLPPHPGFPIIRRPHK